MTDKLRKYVLPNIPYVFIGWVFLKLGTAYRLAAGAGFREKLLGLGQTVGAAFADFAPGLAPFDWLVGIVGAVAFRLLICFKSKNAKKFRRDEEYGSARWGSEKDIRPFVDPKFENNMILTATERITMNTRPKNPANARNLNFCGIGSSGSGKTRFWLTPQLLQAHSSYVVVDPKGGVLGQVGSFLQKRGYKIKVFNSIDFSKSMHYNPLAYIKTEADILKFVNALISNTKGEGKEQYLTFEHDEFTMKPTLDETGRLILREDYRIATLNCGREDFAVACMRANLRYGKNQKREDVKSHHYIISFDPRDAADNGFTVDRAQALGEEFCAEHFPGHQAIVCTHPDGHNHSGNIHVHIVINSLRIEEVPLLPYMDRPADTRAGCKHRCTDAAMEYFKAEVMEMCHRENLYQIDLLHGSKNRITEREYWAQKKGQAKLDKENATLAAEGQPVKQTKFETDKAKLRQTIRNAMSEATTFDEFSALLLRQGVIVKESRGRLSYLTPDRTKPITARKLGGDFDRAAVLALLEQNAHRAAEKTAPIPEYHTAETNRTERGKTQKIAPTGNIQRMVDRAAKRAEGKGIGYDRWAAVHNLKQMAATVAAMEQYGFTPDELDAALVSANADLHSSTAKLKPIETAMSFTIQF